MDFGLEPHECLQGVMTMSQDDDHHVVIDPDECCISSDYHLMEEIEVEMTEESMEDMIILNNGPDIREEEYSETILTATQVTQDEGRPPDLLSPEPDYLNCNVQVFEEEVVCLSDDAPCSDSPTVDEMMPEDHEETQHETPRRILSRDGSSADMHDPSSNTTRCSLSDDQQASQSAVFSHPVSYVCKWTHCDWPGTYDDLVDHIREIHVDLQPYHCLPASRGPKGGWVSSSCSSSSSTSSAASTISSASDVDLNPASVPSICSDPDSTRSPLPSTSITKSRRSSTVISHSKSMAQIEPDKYYVCLWEGCKVYGHRSQSRSWLDRHVLQHSGDKPFKCIVENCGARFKSQSALERHVNSHFNANSKHNIGNSDLGLIGPNDVQMILNSDGSSEHGSDDLNRRCNMMRAKHSDCMNGFSFTHSGTPLKLGLSSSSVSKSKKKIKTKRVLMRGCSEDFFDPTIMDIIQFRLFQLNQAMTPSSGHDGQHIMPSNQHVTFHSTVSRVHSDCLLI